MLFDSQRQFLAASMNISDTLLPRLMFLLILFGFVLVFVFVVRPGTSPSDSHAYTLDHHMHT